MIDQLKYSFDERAAYRTSVAKTQAQLSKWLESSTIDALIITSQDEFISEYLPSCNNPRYALSAFDGSVGSGIFLHPAVAAKLGTPQFILFVDGRYYIQADTQCDPAYVQIEKLGLGASMWLAMAEWLAAHAMHIRKIGYDARRLSVAQREQLLTHTQRANFQWSDLTQREIDHAIQLPGWAVERPIFEVPESITGASVTQNIAALNERLHAHWGDAHLGESDARVCFVTCAADDISYVLNSRGYHLPNASSHLGFLFVIGKEIALFLPQGCEKCAVDLNTYSSLCVIRNDVAALERFLRQFDVKHLCYSAETVNCALLDQVGSLWPAVRHAHFNPVEMMRVSKTPQVLEQFREAFARSSAAIAQTMRWAKYGEPGHRHSEYDLARAINDAYGERGAIGLSFTTIAANGAHSAIAHYTCASAQIELTEGELVLLDSGAYYEGGYATDCTRVVLRKTNSTTCAQPWQKEIYTIVLKACIKGMMTHFPAHTTGEEVDAVVRNVCRAYGYDYTHGTGHGVGIHVHEGGIRFAPGSRYGLTPHAVVSVEPGIYIPGKGGVRIENIVIVHRSEVNPGKMTFENIVTVGYDWDLIDLELLDEGERDYLRHYEQRCIAQGTSVSACPLLAEIAC